MRQQVVRAIVDRIEQDKLITLTHAEQLLAVVRQDIETDFTTREEVASVVAFSHVTPRDIRTAVPYVGSIMLPDYGDSIVPDETTKQKLVASLLLDAQDEVARGSTPAVSLADYPRARGERNDGARPCGARRGEPPAPGIHDLGGPRRSESGLHGDRDREHAGPSGGVGRSAQGAGIEHRDCAHLA